MMREKREWRFIYTGKNDAFFNMALDEALLILSEEKKFPPVLRIYQWEPEAVSMGYSQQIKKTVDLKKCKDMNVDVVRRLTGGRAVLHDNDLTYSICASRSYFDLLGVSINETYKRIGLAFLKSMEFLNIKGEWERKSSRDIGLTPCEFSKPCFSSSIKYEIKVDGKKLIGSAQRRFKASFIQHGSIPLGKQSFDLVDLLPEINEEGKQKIKIRLEKNSVSLQDLLSPNFGINQILSAIKSGFSSFFSVDLKDNGLDTEERRLTDKLIPKYRSERWNSLR
jgi:lipoate-protein ligase A